MRLGVPSRGIARLLLLVWLTGAALPALRAHGSLAEDSACGPWEVLGRHGATALSGAADTTHGDHCALCHLQRAARSAMAATVVAGPDADPHHWVSSSAQSGLRAATSLHLSSRAPPSARL
jgi:hypothetical protein